jgi:hypothetical protein
MDHVCEKCTKTFSNKYTLKKHIEKNICGEEKVKKMFSCQSSKCEYKSIQKNDMRKHLKTCRYVEIDMLVKKEIDALIDTFHKQNESLRLEIATLRIQKECIEKERDNLSSLLEKEREKERDNLSSLLEKAMEKPTTVSNTTTTNIKGSNNNLQSVLANHEEYKKQVDPERIMSLDPSIVEKHFWLGQRGIAKLCVDHIIKTVDQEGKDKLLLCCTDPARKRFKYFDASNQVAEDNDIRHFTSLVSVPIKTVCRDVYDSILKKIEEDKRIEKDAFEMNRLDIKTTQAQKKLLEINDLSDDKRNHEYKNEMTVLLRNE